ncbi:hypothetical protein C1646_755882 [Rhizophagus diaphanus]|nr:hypothetical protein C1646_755882 [Rhizophagus diaphanus] [Rhizophagus sp. MUCL 43196]
MLFEFEVLKQHITELKTENVKLRQIIEKNARHDVENAEQRSRIEELEKNNANILAENTELKTRIVKLEQDSKQLRNDLHFEEAVIIPESVAVKFSGENCVVSEVIKVPANFKSLKEKEMDNFLN